MFEKIPFVSLSYIQNISEHFWDNARTWANLGKYWSSVLGKAVHLEGNVLKLI